MATVIEVKNATVALRPVLEHDIDIPMRDGANLKANLFRPEEAGRYPVLITLGPYSKDIHFSQHRLEAWESMTRDNPQILEASSGKWMVFETPDPEIWVPQGYVVIRIDSRGAAKSPGMLDANSPAEFRDFHDAIEWAGVQPWSNGKVGLLGISYYACGQWMVAALRPPHLRAILPWQGTSDFYRGRTRQGGMFCDGFVGGWWNRIVNKQHGNPDCELTDMVSGERITGPASLDEAERAGNRVDYIDNVLAHPLCDAWYQERIPDLSKIEIPTFVIANWGGLGLHLRGTIRGFMDIASREKWLKVQTGSYFATFFLPESVALQRKFFDHFLKGADNGWEAEPRVEVTVRGADDGTRRIIQDTQWPIARTEWTKLHLDASDNNLAWSAPGGGATATYSATGEGVAFTSAPIERDLELAGPIAARLQVSSSVADMDLFATLRAFGPDGDEATFVAADEPRMPLSQGWLRVTQRKTDPRRSSDYQPFHAHDQHQPLTPGEVYEIDIEIWPASIALPAGSTISLILAGLDFERPGASGRLRGSGPFTHADPRDRPPERHSGEHTIHTGGDRDSYLLVPVIPAG